jgi:sulfate adenylyltransferase
MPETVRISNSVMPLTETCTAEARALRREAASLRAWRLTARQTADLELLGNGGFAPLTGFLGEADYRSVISRMRLAGASASGTSAGALWPIPILLDLPAEFAGGIAPGERLALVDEESRPRAILAVEELFARDLEAEAFGVYGTTRRDHPGVARLLEHEGSSAASGALRFLPPPPDRPFAGQLPSPAELAGEFARLGWKRVVGFQTRNPIHRAHHALMLAAMRAADAKLLLHPTIGETAAGDLDAATRLRCCRAVLAEFPPGSIRLAALPLAMRMAGPREAVLHALVRRNFGCTHFVVGRDHAGPGLDRAGKPFYSPEAARALAASLAPETGIQIVGADELVWAPARKTFVPLPDLRPEEPFESLSGTELRRRLEAGEALPGWFTFPAVDRELRRSTRRRSERGLAVLLTGLSGSGKSTLARALADELALLDDRSVRVLDGDAVRPVLSGGLGFSRADRDTNVLRVGFVAAEIARAGGTAICALIAPYAGARREVRAAVRAAGGAFLLVHVATAIDVCEARDAKGLYAAARAGTLPAFTGVSDPYETPDDADLRLDLSGDDPRAAVEALVGLLRRDGYLAIG